MADFIIVDYEVDNDVPIILDRLFLATWRMLIDMHNVVLTMQVNDEQATFNVLTHSSSLMKLKSVLSS